MQRLRIHYTVWRRAGLVLTDTPRPNCLQCEGNGGIEHDYGDYETGEYAGTDWEPCTCWNEHRRWLLLPLPRLRRPGWLSRHRDPWAANGHGYSDEPPF